MSPTCCSCPAPPRARGATTVPRSPGGLVRAGRPTRTRSCTTGPARPAPVVRRPGGARGHGLRQPCAGGGLRHRPGDGAAGPAGLPDHRCRGGGADGRGRPPRSRRVPGCGRGDDPVRGLAAAGRAVRRGRVGDGVPLVRPGGTGTEGRRRAASGRSPGRGADAACERRHRGVPRRGPGLLRALGSGDAARTTASRGRRRRQLGPCTGGGGSRPVRPHSLPPPLAGPHLHDLAGVEATATRRSPANGDSRYEPSAGVTSVTLPSGVASR